MISPTVFLGEKSDCDIIGSLLRFLWQQSEKDGFGFCRPLAKYSLGYCPENWLFLNNKLYFWSGDS